ncbi:hypothetical protein L585_03985 [Pantoea ananatis BRT175]|nr:hypothetical protein L585_03985 [Pantoea ananatis BRT175]
MTIIHCLHIESQLFNWLVRVFFLLLFWGELIIGEYLILFYLLILWFLKIKWR